MQSLSVFFDYTGTLQGDETDTLFFVKSKFSLFN